MTVSMVQNCHISEGCSCKSSAELVLSVSDKSGWPRVIVGSDRAGSSVCRHDKCCSMPGLKRKGHRCKKVAEWLKAGTTGEHAARRDRLSALAAEMEEYRLLSDRQSSAQGQDADISNFPVSASKIQLHDAHHVMQAHVNGQLGKFQVLCHTL